jgi:hypothetical protein
MSFREGMNKEIGKEQVEEFDFKFFRICKESRLTGIN